MEFPAKIRYTVDFSQASHYADFYNAIRKGLDLPDYVGKNTDALWDCLKGFIEWPCEITITGLSSLSQGLLREVQNVLTVFKQAEKAYPQDIRVIMEDEKSFCENYEYTIDLAAANDKVWKIMQGDNHLHQAIMQGLGMPWRKQNAQNMKEAIGDYLTGHLEDRPTVITIKNTSLMGEKYKAEWEDMLGIMQKAARQYPEQIKIVIMENG